MSDQGLTTIAKAFATRYYDAFINNPKKLLIFYTEESSFCHKDESSSTSSITGIDEIEKALSTFDYSNHYVDFNTIQYYPQASANGGIMLTITGDLVQNLGTRPRHFIHIFFLARFNANNDHHYFILNDFLLFLNQQNILTQKDIDENFQQQQGLEHKQDQHYKQERNSNDNLLLKDEINEHHIQLKEEKTPPRNENQQFKYEDHQVNYIPAQNDQKEDIQEKQEIQHEEEKETHQQTHDTYEGSDQRQIIQNQSHPSRYTRSQNSAQRYHDKQKYSQYSQQKYQDKSYYHKRTEQNEQHQFYLQNKQQKNGSDNSLQSSQTSKHVENNQRFQPRNNNSRLNRNRNDNQPYEQKNQQSLQGPTRDEPRENVNLSRPMYDDQEQPKRNHLNTPVEIQQEYQSGPSKSNRHLRDQENSNQFTNIDNRKSINEKQNDGRFRESRGGGSRNNNYNNHQYLHRNPNNRPSNRGSNNVRNASP